MATKMQAKASAAAARRGAKFLDTIRKGWFWDIRVTKLDLGSSCNCILGQLHGDYVDGTSKVGIGDKAAANLGFLTKWKRDDWGYSSIRATAYPMLTQAWANEVRTRRGFKPLDLTNPNDGQVLVSV